MSGALKSANIIKALANDEMVEKMRGDIKATIGDKVYTIESKRNVNSDTWYKKQNLVWYTSKVLHIFFGKIYSMP